MSMFRPVIATVFIAAGAAVLATIGVAQTPSRAVHPTGTDAHPVVVELFQSQGCSSCPPAAANVNAIAGRPGVLALSFGVTYWDNLGWKDTFASPRFTARQWDYAHRAGRGEVATPQVIVNGAAAIVGNNRQQLDAAIARAGAPRGGPALTATGAMLHVGAGRPSGPATVWLVRYDPRTVEVPIRAGENGGRTLPHRDVVHDLVRLGGWTGTPSSFALPAAPAKLASAVLVQQGAGGPITAAIKL